MHEQRGVSVLEVLIVIGMLAIIITGVGSALGANHRLTAAAEAKSAALNYARQALEAVVSIQQTAFGCSGGTNGICNGQPCVTRPGYTSCWTEFAVGLNSGDPLQLVPAGSSWQLADGVETIVAERTYQRQLAIVNQQRNANGELVESGGTPDFNTKEVTVTVTWEESGVQKNFSLSTILTAWKNQP